MVNRSGIWAYSASVAGARHLRRGVERQDRAFHRVEADFAIGVVSDGAGSARNAALGATVTTTRATSAAAWRMLDLAKPPTPADLEEVLRESAYGVRQSLEELSRQTGEPLRSYANTLLLSIQTDTLLGAAQVGDGGMVISNDGGSFDCLTSPQHGEYVNQTTFITSREWLEQMEVKVVEAQPKYLAMFSDGLENLVIERATQQPFFGFFNNVFQWLEGQSDPLRVEAELSGLLRSSRVTSKSDDDITLLLTIRR